MPLVLFHDGNSTLWEVALYRNTLLLWSIHTFAEFVAFSPFCSSNFSRIPTSGDAQRTAHWKQSSWKSTKQQAEPGCELATPAESEQGNCRSVQSGEATQRRRRRREEGRRDPVPERTHARTHRGHRSLLLNSEWEHKQTHCTWSSSQAQLVTLITVVYNRK